MVVIAVVLRGIDLDVVARLKVRYLRRSARRSVIFRLPLERKSDDAIVFGLQHQGRSGGIAGRGRADGRVAANDSQHARETCARSLILSRILAALARIPPAAGKSDSRPSEDDLTKAANGRQNQKN
jgi:hypothetical protein